MRKSAALQILVLIAITLLTPGEGQAVSLRVGTEPGDARVRILNIARKFYQGIELLPGKYHVEVSAAGYDTKKRWVELGPEKETYIEIRLNKIRKVQHSLQPESYSVGEGVGPFDKSFTNSVGMKFVLIPAGSFMMGSPTNEPKRDNDEKWHRVSISKPFYLQTTEVTHRQWCEIVGNNPSHSKNCGDDCPVERVSWNDAQEFISKLNRWEGANKYRLPTEAEWEYACRAGTDTSFTFGRCLSTAQANYDGNYPMPGCPQGEDRERLVRAGSFPPNAWGLHDMHGNVWEWCQDWYGAYPTDHVTDPSGPSSGSYRVLRGGSWYNLAWNCRSSSRRHLSPGDSRFYLGFRLARTP
jgi:formylglycine-generating enzyme required for sulfatase activity